jgi:hypothetical protein
MSEEPTTQDHAVNVDVLVTYQSFGAVVKALSPAGKGWIASNTMPAGQGVASGLVVDEKVIGDVIEAMQRDGLKVHCGE